MSAPSSADRMQARARAARLVSTSLLVLAVILTGAMLWRGLQPVLVGDVRRDLLLDLAHVRLVSGFEQTEALSARKDEKYLNPDRDEIALTVRRNSVVEWDIDARPGRFRMGLARLVIGSAADATPCTITVSAFGATAGDATGGDATNGDRAAPRREGGEAGAVTARAIDEPPLATIEATALPCLADADAHPALWREGPASTLSLDLPAGVRTLRIEVRATGSGPDAAPEGAAFALLSPRFELEPLRTPLADARRSVGLEVRLLPGVPPVSDDGRRVLFATRRSADAPDAHQEVLQPPVQALAAFTGPPRDGRPAVVLTGEAAVSWVVDVPPDSVLRAASALDVRLPPGARATLEVRVDGEVVASRAVDSQAWCELSVDLGAHAGTGRRIECALVKPELVPAEVAHEDPDFVSGETKTYGYTARVVSLGLADPRLVRESQVLVRRATSGRPSVILIQVETLRADALGELLALASEAAVPGATPGAAAELRAASHTPHLDAFARRSTVWLQAFTPAPWTLPTTVSLLTGLLPSAHGAVDHDRLVVPGDVPTLAELAGRAGVATGAVVASELLRPTAGFARGFDSYAHLEYANARQVNDLAGAFLANHAGEQFLLFLHYFDPHNTYAAPDDWRERFVDADLRGQDIHAVEARVVDELKRATAAGSVPAPDPRDVRFLRQRYEGEVAWFDSQFGKLIDRLQALGLTGSTLIAFTSDHGEEFLEHGLWGHGSALYDEALHVPLIVSGPRGLPGLSLSGTRITAPVSTVGLFASVLRWLDVPCDAASARPPLDAPERAAYSETNKGIALGGGGDPLRRHLHRVRSADWMLTWREPVTGDQTAGPPGDEPAGGVRQLFDLRTDPGARVPLPVEGDSARSLWDELGRAIRWSGEHRASSPLPGGDAAQLDTIRELGYIGGDKPKPAPK